MIIPFVNLEIPDYIFFWIVFIIGIALIYIFGICKNYELKEKFDHLFKKNLFWIIFIFAYLFFMNHLGFWKGNFWIKKENSIFLLILFGYILIKSLINDIRYKEIHAICDNRSGSCARYVQRGDYIILNIGSTDYFDNGNESWVIPAKHFNKINNKSNSSKTQIVIKTNVEKIDILEIPHEAYNFFETEASSNGYNKYNIYYGEFSVEELNKCFKDDKGNKLSPEYWLTKMKNQNRLQNETQAMLKGKLALTKKFVSDANIIQKKASGQSAYNVNNSGNSNTEY